MRTYDTYKDSGISWLGQIPSHWDVKRLGSYFTERRQKVSDKDYEPLSVTKQGIFPQLENVAKTNDGDNRKLVRKGDFVINSRSDRKGSSGVSELDGSVSLINIVLEPHQFIIPAFCNFLLKSHGFIEEYYRIGRGIVADLWTTRYQEMKFMPLAVPPLAEQEAIVAYLDGATAEIDKAIASQQHMVELLQERKQIIINQAVTQGLNPDAPMKDSGVEWIGRIPKHWLMTRIKFLGSICSGDGISSSEIGLNGTYEAYGGNGLMGYTERYNISTDKVIIGRVGAQCGNIHISRGKRFISDNALIFTPNNKVEIDYIANYMIFADLNKLNTSSAQPLITGTKVVNVVIPLPHITEQREIVAYIKRETKRVEYAIQQARLQIELFTERKQILINDVVTGKIKII